MIRPRAEVDRLAPYRPGRPAGACPAVNLAANENAWGPSPRVAAAVAGVPSPARYPEPGGVDVAEILAVRWGVPAHHLLLGTGSGHLLKCLAETYLGWGDRVVTTFPTFSLYAHDSRLMGAGVEELPGDGHTVRWEALPTLVRRAHPCLVWICSPNNPTGDAIPDACLDAVLEAVDDDALVVLDEAYVQFSDRPAGWVQRVTEEPRLAVVRTFSKAYGLAAYRLGVLAAWPEIVEAVGRVREPFPVSAAASAAALAALSDEEHTAAVVRATRAGRERLERDLAARGWRVAPSLANFVWAVPPSPWTADAVHAGLAARGVLVRAGSGFGVPDHLRISVGTPAELDQLLAALDALAGEGG